MNLAKYPASTVQILGAEKALFRALKTRGNTPKHGLLFHSTFISRAVAKNKGRISRFLANKCSIASRIDCFMESQNDIYGSKLKEQVEERLTFYENGTIPKKNIDVMHEAMEEARIKAKAEKKLRKKLKKEAKKRKREEAEAEAAAVLTENGKLNDIDHNEEEMREEVQAEDNNEDGEPAPKKMKKKKKKKDKERESKD
jgi:nucleolar protein 56